MKRTTDSKRKKAPSHPPIDGAVRARAEAFLARAIPEELKPHYMSGSLAEVAIRLAASGATPDAELLEIVEMSAGEYESQIAEARSDELKAYFAECSALLSQILYSTRAA